LLLLLQINQKKPENLPAVLTKLLLELAIDDVVLDTKSATKLAETFNIQIHIDVRPGTDESDERPLITNEVAIKKFFDNLTVILKQRPASPEAGKEAVLNILIQLLTDHSVLDKDSAAVLLATFGINKGVNPLTPDTVTSLHIKGSIEGGIDFITSLKKLLAVKSQASQVQNLAALVSSLIDLLVESNILDVHSALKFSIGQGSFGFGSVGKYLVSSVDNMLGFETSKSFSGNDKLALATRLLQELEVNRAYNPVCMVQESAIGTVNKMVNGNALLSSINDLIGLDASLLYSNDEKLSFAKRLVRELQDNEVVDADCADKAPRKS